MDVADDASILSGLQRLRHVRRPKHASTRTRTYTRARPLRTHRSRAWTDRCARARMHTRTRTDVSTPHARLVALPDGMLHMPASACSLNNAYRLAASERKVRLVALVNNAGLSRRLPLEAEPADAIRQARRHTDPCRAARCIPRVSRCIPYAAARLRVVCRGATAAVRRLRLTAERRGGCGFGPYYSEYQPRTHVFTAPYPNQIR
jgi:hypothetical protein